MRKSRLVGGSWKIGGKRGLPGDLSGKRFVDRNVIDLKRPAHILVESDARVAIVGERLLFGALGGGERLLVRDHLENRGCTQGVFFLVGVERLPLQNTRFDGRIVAHSGLPQSDDGVLYVDAN